MGTIPSQITNLTIVYSTVYSDTDQRKYQSSASLAFVHKNGTCICLSLQAFTHWNRDKVYEQFSLQPAHPCFKIDQVGSSRKFSYMSPVYMVITSENKKMIWKVVFKISTYVTKTRALWRHFYGSNADIWQENEKWNKTPKWNKTHLYIFLLAITKTLYDLRQYQSHRGIRESEKYVPNVHDNARNKWRAWSRTCTRRIQTLANDVLIRYSHAKNTLVV